MGGCLLPNGDCVYIDKKACVELQKGTVCKSNIFGRRLQDPEESAAAAEETTPPTTTTTTTTTPETIGLFYDLSTRGKNAWLKVVRQLERLKRDQYQQEKGYPTHPDGENLFEEFMQTINLNFRGSYGKGSTQFNLTVVSAYGEGNDAFKFFGTSFSLSANAAYWSFGSGADGYTKDDDPDLVVSAKTSKFNAPVGLAIDKANQLYVADSMNARVRRVNIEDVSVQTMAGEGLQYFQGDGGLGVEGSMNMPTDLVVDKSGVAFVADTHNHRIRRVDGLVFSPPCPNINKHFADIGIPSSRSPLMQKFQKDIIGRTQLWGGGADYTAYEYVTNRWVDANGVPINEWMEESKEAKPVDKIKKRTEARIPFLFELAVTAAYECGPGRCNRTENKIIKGCGSATEWALCRPDKREMPLFQEMINIKKRIAQQVARVCIGETELKC
jgi:hypothetical protein